ncbi:MAG: SusC/RagA family TonB-linked outer membrane protein [Gemmatimonadota bacterium]|nr:MAG: SusC/RagA family TonB-linked outer membrane protein [Gemmatimonadota bacterium]
MFRVRYYVSALIAIGVCAGQLVAQATGNIAGRIVDASTQEPIALVVVRVADRTEQTDAEGRFVISGIPAGRYVLRANLLGYRAVVDTVTVVSGQTADVQIAMDAVAFAVEGVVVTGYGEQERRDLTGVVTEVRAEAFNTGRVISNEELIKGKVAGVQVTEDNGGEPGGGLSIRIRGGTSISSSNEPLYVIDGVPLPPGGGLSAGRNPMSFINPEDIESVTVLKDASATAIYGSQGANGVVIVETRAGADAAARTGAAFTYRGNVSSSTIAKRPDILNAAQFREVVAAEAPQQVQYLGDADTDWIEQVEQSAIGQEHTLVVAGGTRDMSFRVSGGYLGQEGVLQKTKWERLSLNVAYNHRLFDDRLNLHANIMGARTEDKFTPGGVLGNATNMAPTQPVFDENSPYGGYFEWDDPLATDNPVGQLNLIQDEGTTFRSIGNVTGEYAIPRIDGLSATARLGYVVTNSERRSFYPSILKAQEENGSNGTVSRSNPTETSYLFDGFLTYERDIDEHGLILTGGYSFNGWNWSSPSFYAQQLHSDMLGLNGVPTADLERTSLFIDQFRLASWFGRVNYTFRDKYLVTATVRWDGSSKFGKGNQWGTFPSAAVAWRISEEPFMYGAGFISDLKLRLSWGKNGNQAFPSYQQYKDYVFGGPQAQALFGDEYVSTIRPSAADPNIKWEETKSWNIGVDYGLWNDRVFGAVELYTKRTEDLIFDVIVAAGTNLSNVVTTNVGTMTNKGIEFTLNTTLFQAVGDGFNWDFNINAAYNKNEVKQINPFGGEAEQIVAGPFISGGVGSTVQVLQPGYARNSFLLYQHILDGAGNPIYEDVNGDGSINEQDLYVDANEDGIVNFDDRVPMNNPAPDWILGSTSIMRWKSFDFSFTLLAQLGNYMYNNVASSTGFYERLTQSARPSNLHASALKYNFSTSQYFSDAYLEDASFLRMENIELGYTFRQALNGIRVYGILQNAFTITGYSGVDPTSTTSGIDNNIYPRTRTFTAGLTVGF